MDASLNPASRRMIEVKFYELCCKECFFLNRRNRFVRSRRHKKAFQSVRSAWGMTEQNFQLWLIALLFLFQLCYLESPVFKFICS